MGFVWAFCVYYMGSTWVLFWVPIWVLFGFNSGLILIQFGIYLVSFLGSIWALCVFHVGFMCVRVVFYVASIWVLLGFHVGFLWVLFVFDVGSIYGFICWFYFGFDVGLV